YNILYMQYFVIKFMNWSEFISHIIREFRLSEVDLASISGMTYPTVNRIRRGITISPNQSTIKRLEEGLKIKIDDRDPSNITYKKLIPDKEYEMIDRKLFEYPVLTKVYAGSSPMMLVSEEISEYITLPYEKKENCFAVIVRGDSMNHIIQEGDIVLADMDKEIINGKIVIARLRNGKQIIKRYRELPGDLVMFYSDNGSYEPLTLPKSEIEALYRVVGIWKGNL
ncbi:MAG: S24 family peptidase, partial [Elusimicrobiota bacterium]